MSRFGKNIGRRILAYLLSGAMIMSNMTAFASEPSPDTVGRYIYEQEADDDTAKESDDGDVEIAEEIENNVNDIADSEDDADNADSEKEDKEENIKSESLEDDKNDNKENNKNESPEDDKKDNEELKDGIKVHSDTFVEEKTYDFKSNANSAEYTKEKLEETFSGITFNNMAGDGNNHGVYTSDSEATMVLNLSKKANITVTTCCYNASTNATMSASSGTVGNPPTEWEEDTANHKNGLKFTVTDAEAGELTLTFSNNTYIHSVAVEYVNDGNEGGEDDPDADDPEEEEREAATKIVWDFQNNKYIVDGTTAEKDLSDGYEEVNNSGDKPKTGTLKGLKIDATAQSGAKLAIRSSGDAQINQGTSVKIPVYGKSKVTIVANGNNYSYEVDKKTATSVTAEFTGVGDYAEFLSTGTSYLYSITVEKEKTAAVTGSVTLDPAATEAVKIIFTEKVTDRNPAVVEAEIGADNSYKANLFVGSTYTVTLSNKDYTVANTCAEIEVGASDTAKTFDITATGVTTTEVTGTIVNAPSNLEITVKSAENHNPEVTITGNTYKVNLKPGTDYTVTATGTHINDYTYTDKINSTSESNDITFTEKMKYGVNITVDSYDKKMNGSSLELTFTNKNEEGYSYDFTGTDNVSLRNGTYSLTIKDLSYPYIDASGTLTVNGTEETDTADYTIKLNERMKWDFTNMDYALETKTVTNANYHGLDITGTLRIAGTNAEMKAGTVIKIPVSGKGTVEIICNSYNYKNGIYTMNGTANNTAEKVYTQTWNYNTFDKTSADYVAGGYMVMAIADAAKLEELIGTAGQNPYLNTITVTRSEEAPEEGNSGSEESSDPEGSESEPSTPPVTESYVTAGKKDFKADLQANPSLAFETAYHGITFNNFDLSADDGNHGFHTSNTATPTMVLNLSKKADITIEACAYWSTSEEAPERDLGITSGELTSADNAEGSLNGKLYTITGADKGKLTITFGHGLFIHNIEVSYLEEESSEAENSEENSKVENSEVESSADESSKVENSEVDKSEEEESQPIKDDTVEDKIKADPDAPKKTIKMSDTDAIKIQAADIVENKKYNYAVSVTYTYKTEKDGKPVTYQQQLTEGVHYEVEKKENTDGSCYVMVYGLGETDLGIFVGSANSNNYTIWTSKDAKENKAKDLSKAKIKLDNKSATFTGSYITPAVTVTDPADKTKNLTEGTDYTVVYKNNVNVGKASVTVIGTKGESGYFGSATATFSIKAAPLAKSTVNIKADNMKEGLANDAGKKGKVTAEEKNAGDFAYTGEPITFKNLTLELVSNEGKTVSKLSPSTYTVTYKKNTAKGTATATIKGLNNVSGAITVSYAITNAVDGDAIKALTTSTAATPLAGEYSSKGVRLTEIKVGNVTLKENVDYKADYKECAKTAELNKEETVSITGIGSYKKVFDKVSVKVKTGPGEFHLKKSGVIVDKSKIYDKKSGALDAKKLISAAKITDASGATIKPEAIDTTKIVLRNNKITLTPSDTTNYKESELTDLHVATKITAALKQNKTDVLNGYFDGVNTATTTETAIVNTLTKLTTPAITANDISIVSYKNNHKLGNATVTIQATDNSAYYGSMNVKFTITAVSGADRMPSSDDPDDPDNPDDPKLRTEWGFREGSELMGENGVLIQGSTDTVEGLEIDATASGAKFDSKSRTDWAQVNTGTIIKVPVAGASRVTITVYDSGSTYTVDDKADPNDGESFLCKGTDGYVTIVMTSNGYIGSIKVESIDPNEIPDEPDDPKDQDDEVDEKNNFKVWLDDLAQGGTVAAKAYEYPSGTITLIGNKESDGSETQFTKSYSAAIDVKRDDETHSGYKAGNRPSAAGSFTAIPKPGDGCCVVFEAKATGMFKMYFYSTSFLRVSDFNTESGTKNGDMDSKTAADFYAFDVVPGHTYVMCTTGATNNMAYIGYQFIQNMNIEIEAALNNIDAEVGALDALELTLTDAALGTKKAVVKNDTEKIRLLKNHTYEITSNDGSVRAEVGGKDTFTVTSDDKITFDLYNVPDQTLTGEITGTPEGTVKSLKFVNMENNSEFEATITGTTYSCAIKPGEYNTIVETTNGGKTYDRVSVKVDVENVNEVYVEVPDSSKTRTYAPADIEKLETTGSVKFRSANGDVTASPGSTIKVPVTGKAAVIIETYYEASYKVGDKEYTNTTGSTGSNQSDKMTVEGDLVIEVTGSGTTYFKAITVSPVVEFKSTLDVPGDYDTLNKAFDAIAAMENRPEGEAGRVTVNLNKDIREQTVVRASYVTLKGNNHTVDWYYGVGTLYYSIDPSTGLYSERLARDKYSSTEGDGNLWGGAFLVYGDNFIAEDTTFKNTYNYELTNEEKTDIAGSALSVNRLAVTNAADVAKAAYKERSNAFYIAANNIECYNCQILSSQDTLGRNGNTNNGYHVYFKNCVIGGNVDYICGEFAAVFDNCELQWKTLSDSGNDKIGYIVAPKTNPYVFRNCIVTTDRDVSGVKGHYGRTWGDKSNASFIYTETNGYINTTGWGEMSSGQGATATFKEYGNTSGDAPFATTSSLCPAANKTLEAVQDYIDEGDTSKIITDVLGGWEPLHYSYEEGTKGPVNSDASN